MRSKLSHGPLRNSLGLLLATALSLTSHHVLAQAANPLHISFTNDTHYGDGEVYVWFTGNTGSGNDGVKIHGTNTPIALHQSYALSSISGGVDVSHFASGRIYFSLGGQIGSGQPNLDAPFRYDFMEITYTGQAPDVADLTAMDQFGIPLTMQLRKGGTDLTGPNTSAGWKGNSDQQIINALASISTNNANIKTDSSGNFLRVIGATDIHYTHLYSPEKMDAYVNSIKASGRTVTIASPHEAGGYRYDGTFDGAGNWIFTKASGDGWDTIVVNAETAWGGNPADPSLSIAEQIFASDPKISQSVGDPLFTASDTNLVPQSTGLAMRDLFAALNLGYIDNEHTITADDIVGGEYAYLIGKHLYELTTDEMRRGLKVAFDEVGEYFNFYALEVQKISDAYGYAYSDWNENLVKVAILPGAEHGGLFADELNITLHATDVLVIPEPGTYALFGCGALCLLYLRRRRVA